MSPVNLKLVDKLKAEPTHHKHRIKKKLDFALIIVSDTRYKEEKQGGESTDETTPIVKELVERAGHRVKFRIVVPDEKKAIVKAINTAISKGVDVVVASGGTGLAKRDVTVEAVLPLLEKKIPGFGELLRFESYKEIGPAAMLTRAEAGIYRGVPVFCLPGSPNAAHIALTKLILPEINHIIYHVE